MGSRVQGSQDEPLSTPLMLSALESKRSEEVGAGEGGMCVLSSPCDCVINSVPEIGLNA